MFAFRSYHRPIRCSFCQRLREGSETSRHKRPEGKNVQLGQTFLPGGYQVGFLAAALIVTRLFFQVGRCRLMRPLVFGLIHPRHQRLAIYHDAHASLFSVERMSSCFKRFGERIQDEQGSLARRWPDVYIEAPDITHMRNPSWSGLAEASQNACLRFFSARAITNQPRGQTTFSHLGTARAQTNQCWGLIGPLL